MNEAHNVTQILKQVEEGDSSAAEALLPLIYDELRKLAAVRLAGEKPGQTLQATALVHEAWLRLLGNEAQQAWDSSGHFFAAAAEAMRRILVEQARSKNAEKRGGSLQRVDLEDALRVFAPSGESANDLLSLDEALQEFERVDPTKAALVKLRFFAGLTIEEAATAMGISAATAKRQWIYARSWLYGKLRGDESSR